MYNSSFTRPLHPGKWRSLKNLMMMFRLVFRLVFLLWMALLLWVVQPRHHLHHQGPGHRTTVIQSCHWDKFFLRIAQGPSLKNLVAFFACLCVFTALSNKVGTDDRCWHCSQRAKDDLEPQACAPARCDDPLALLDFFSSTFLGTFFWWNKSHFGVFDASPSEEACAALPVGSSRVQETHGLPNDIVLSCFQQMFGRIFSMFFIWKGFRKLRYRGVLGRLHQEVGVTLPNVWLSDLSSSGEKKSIHSQQTQSRFRKFSTFSKFSRFSRISRRINFRVITYSWNQLLCPGQVPSGGSSDIRCTGFVFFLECRIKTCKIIHIQNHQGFH